MNIHIDDVFDEFFLRDDWKGGVVDTTRHLIDLVQLLTHEYEFLLHEPLEPRTQIECVDEPSMFLIEDLIYVFFVLLLLQEHFFERILHLHIS